MGMEYYHDLKKMLCKELENVANQKELSAGDLETVDKNILDNLEIIKVSNYKEIYNMLFKK